MLLVGYGIVSRVLRSAVEEAREQGLRAGSVPAHHVVAVPHRSAANSAAAHAHKVLVVELSTGQMVEDVRLALDGKVPVEFYGRTGGNVPSVEEILAEVLVHMTSVA